MQTTRLILMRRVEESVQLGDGAESVRVKIVGVRGKAVSLLFEAPREHRIMRSELLDPPPQRPLPGSEA